MDKYAELRAALTDGSFDFDQRAYMNDVRALLAERDALWEALDELANGYAGSGWDIGLRQRLQKARAALAQGES